MGKKIPRVVQQDVLQEREVEGTCLAPRLDSTGGPAICSSADMRLSRVDAGWEGRRSIWTMWVACMYLLNVMVKTSRSFENAGNLLISWPGTVSRLDAGWEGRGSTISVGCIYWIEWWFFVQLPVNKHWSFKTAGNLPISWHETEPTGGRLGGKTIYLNHFSGMHLLNRMVNLNCATSSK